LTEHLFTVAEAAEFASVSERTIWRWLSDEGLPKCQPSGPGTAIRIDPEHLRAFVGRSSHERYRTRLRTLHERRRAEGAVA
jgi:excisionase family DNA binding protein